MVVATRSASKALLRQNNPKRYIFSSIWHGNGAILGMVGVIGFVTVACWLGFSTRAGSSSSLDIVPSIIEKKSMVEGACMRVVEEETGLTVLGAPEEAVDPPSSSLVSMASRYIAIGVGGLVLICIVLCVALKRSVDGCRRLREELVDKEFETETLQASMRILESELERKILQPDGVKVDKSDLFGRKEDDGDVIPAGWGGEQESRGLSDDVVESFLQDRGALAIQEEQVDRWMRMEEEWGQLKELKGILQLHVPGDKRSKTEKIHAAMFLLDSMHLE